MTGHSPSTVSKTVYLTPTILGFADQKNGKSYVSPTLDQDVLNYVVSHELTHLFYRDTIAELNESRKLMTTGLNEGINHMLLFKSPMKDLIKTRVTYDSLAFVKKNPEFMKELEILWQRRKDFDEFLKNAFLLSDSTKKIVPA